MGMNTTMLLIMQWFFIVGAAICVIRLLLGPTTADRLVALNVLSGAALAFLVVRGVAQGRVLYLDVALVYDIFGFLGFMAIARFLKDKITKREEP
jgi:multicomponent Na+:H+ antiporter subunit F